MAITWQKEMSIGFDALDSQHKELLQRFNSFLHACKGNKGSQELSSLLTFLDEYMEHHFTDEEQIMIHYQFPEYIAHKKEHDGFVAWLDTLKREITQDGFSVYSVIATNSFLLNWLQKHIAESDKKIGLFFQTTSHFADFI